MVAAATWRARSRGGAVSGAAPPLSILKPVHGRDPQFYKAILSHATQEYPEFEILFGTNNVEDPALPDIRRLQKEFPNRRIEIVIANNDAPNAKVGVLEELAKLARFPVLLVNDSDIVVEPGYLHAVTAPLANPGVGLVTCLYRAAAQSWPARSEALGIATEFAPSVMVARLLGVADFALGSTMVFRTEALERIGGFRAIANYLADDYQLGRHIAQLGYRIEFAPVVVETDLGGGSWGQIWRHQLRWSRTIRVSRSAGYYGYVVTHATLWSLVALAAGQWQAAAAVLAVRVAAGVWIGAGILGDAKVLRDFWMIPLRDLFGFAIWAGGLSGDTVQWRDRRLKLRPDGRILDEPQAAPTPH
uniref:Glycosyl transferase, family 2 n=1 Tax=Solibacter usitatus (strain Ellin6076) TaxID=234267 RepID=Q01SJ6_SOLUE